MQKQKMYSLITLDLDETNKYVNAALVSINLDLKKLL